jgi:hypothetical protein
MSVTFKTQEDLDAIIKVLDRAIQFSVETNNRAARRGDVDLKALQTSKKALVSAAPGSPIALNRPQVRVISGLLLTSTTTLLSSIIPNYEKRIEDDPSTKARYEPYINDCTKRVEIYRNIIKILNSAL